MFRASLDFEPTTTEVVSLFGAFLIVLSSHLGPGRSAQLGRDLRDFAGEAEKDGDTRLGQLATTLADAVQTQYGERH